jgi:hypothetical protein
MVFVPLARQAMRFSRAAIPVAEVRRQAFASEATMDRSDFLKTACTAGLFSCFPFTLDAMSRAEAAGGADEAAGLRWKVDQMAGRFAKLVEVIAATVDEPTQRKIFEGLGRECARTYGAELISRHEGDLEGFLKAGRKAWMAQADYDPAKGTLRVVDPRCTCPLVQVGVTPGAFCQCTLGWQKEAYARIAKRPVQSAELEESILRGGQRCVFKVKLG